MRLPGGLGWWRHEAGGAEWLERLPGIGEECASAWRLEVGPAFEQAHVSFVPPAVRRDGRQAVLKINFPESESEREADALTSRDGDGAVRLLEHDPERRALLVERCDPGVSFGVFPRKTRTAVERRLIEGIVEFLSDVGPAQGEAVVLHQDFHGGNVLRSERGWLAIDPKPLVGERESTLAGGGWDGKLVALVGWLAEAR